MAVGYTRLKPLILCFLSHSANRYKTRPRRSTLRNWGEIGWAVTGGAPRLSKPAGHLQREKGALPGSMENM